MAALKTGIPVDRIEYIGGYLGLALGKMPCFQWGTKGGLVGKIVYWIAGKVLRILLLRILYYCELRFLLKDVLQGQLLAQSLRNNLPVLCCTQHGHAQLEPSCAVDALLLLYGPVESRKQASAGRAGLDHIVFRPPGGPGLPSARPARCISVCCHGGTAGAGAAQPGATGSANGGSAAAQQPQARPGMSSGSMVARQQ